MLKKRQSSKAPVNLKRSAPSAKPQNIKGHQAPSAPSPPQRASTFPAQLLSRSSANEASNIPKTLDDSASRNLGTWAAPTPELLTEPVSTPSDQLSGDQSSSVSPLQTSMPNQDLSALYMSQPFGDIGNVPDLMPIMFPSDDPFAYPTQPMSTLEDGHFRQNGAGAQSFPFPFAPTSQPPALSSTQTADPTATTMGMANPSFNSFPSMPVFPNGQSTTMGTGVPNQYQQHRRQISSKSQFSPVSQSPVGTPGEPISSPDLVSIPNQNFAWQNYNFQSQNFPDQSSQQQMPALNGNQGFDINMDGNDSTGVGLDLGIPLDDILGNDAFRPSGSFSNDDWTQWMNVGV